MRWLSDVIQSMVWIASFRTNHDNLSTMETITRWVQHSWFYNLAVWSFRTYLRIFWGYKIYNRHNVPMGEHGLLLASNHISLYDPPLLGSVTPRPVHFMAKRELFENRYLAALCLGLQAFPVTREKSDMGAIKYALRLLKQHEVVGIFIQGTRHTRDDNAFTGAAFLARRADVPLLPTAIWRTGRTFHVAYGEPFYVKGKDKEALAEATDVLMKQIKFLLETHAV